MDCNEAVNVIVQCKPKLGRKKVWFSWVQIPPIQSVNVAKQVKRHDLVIVMSSIRGSA